MVRGRREILSRHRQAAVHLQPPGHAARGRGLRGRPQRRHHPRAPHRAGHQRQWEPGIAVGVDSRVTHPAAAGGRSGNSALDERAPNWHGGGIRSMGTVTTRRSLALAGVVIATAAACLSPRSTSRERAAGAPHRGTLALIVRGDTTVRDDYVRGDTTLQGTVRPLVRGAKFGWARYDVRFAQTGEVRRVVLSLGRVGTSPDSAPVSTHSTTFGPDLITEEW